MMKKCFAVIVACCLSIISGCTVMYSDNNSSDATYSEEYTNYIDDVISQIEQDISNRQEAGEITVSVEEEVYYIEDDTPYVESENGKQNTIIGGEQGGEEIKEIKPADVNTVGEKPLYYTYLTDAQKQIYRYMKTAAEQMTDGLFSVGAVKSGEKRFSDIAVAFRALSADNPQLFWLPSNYLISTDGSSVAFSYEQKGASYSMTLQEKQQAEIRLKTTVNNLVAQANAFSSRYQKELFFHDWLCENVVYKDDGTDDSYSAYGALVNGAAVCEGYSRAMQLLCDSVGIPCTVVYGSSRGVGHMWNIINPGDGWYHLDVTWDDDQQYSVIRHAYFNLNDDQILSDHDMFDVVEPGKYYVGGEDFNIHIYDCNFDQYNYFKKSNLLFTGDYTADAQIVLDAAQKGAKCVEVGYSGDEYEAFLTQINIAIFQSGSDIWISDYSYLGDSLFLWW